MLIAFERASMYEQWKNRRALHPQVGRRLTIYSLKLSKYTPPDGFPRTLRAQRVYHAIFYKFSHKLQSQAVKSCFCWSSAVPAFAAFAVIELPLPNSEYFEHAFKIWH
ncbi:unnamed protein product [Euphydryas editha]|uniref:Uncharacterized protein n=1 Tax=Euphydryas editha TaxID=104508 RepID=A0AAU9UUR4_EUPED|nr:unnamed protein product [Euphydryas editha]